MNMWWNEWLYETISEWMNEWMLVLNDWTGISTEKVFDITVNDWTCKSVPP